MEKTRVDLSIIIVSWNTKEYLKACLESIYRDTPDLTFEVFVVDNASSDGSAGMLKAEFPQVVLLANKKNVGFAKANNQAIRESQGRYLLLLNPDTIVLSGTIRSMFDFMENYSDVGASGGRILNPDREIEPFRSAKRFPTPLSKFFVDVHLDQVFPRSRFFGDYSITGWNREDVREVDVISGAFLFVRREAVDEAGLLDDRFFLLAEDIDWCWRIKEKKWKILFNPEAEIIHHGGKSIDQVKRTRLKHEIYSHVLYFEKHHGKLAAFQYRVLAGFTNFLKANYWILKWIFGKNRKIASNNSKAHFKAIFYSLLSVSNPEGS